MTKTGVLMAGVCGLIGAGSAWAQSAPQALTAAQARYQAMAWGCTSMSRLSVGPSGNWHGECQKSDRTVSIIIDKAGKVSQGTSQSVTSANARADLMAYGCSDVSTLSRGPQGSWHARCDKGGKTVDAAVNPQGQVSTH